MASKMYFVYILKSEKNGRHYIGHTESVELRISRHNTGHVKSTQHGRPWKCIYFEEFHTRSEASLRELEIKSYKGGFKFKRLVSLLKD